MAGRNRQNIRDRKVSPDAKRVRLRGEKGSDQNTLRNTLYAYLKQRLADANEQAMYFEILAICDQLITDRIEAYTQYLLFNDESEFPTESIGTALQFLGTAVKDKAPEVRRNEEYKTLFKRLEEFSEMRNEVLHGFILIKNVATDISLAERIEWAEHACEVGNKLVSDWSSWVRKQIDQKKLENVL